jgi:hypothetical protein
MRSAWGNMHRSPADFLVGCNGDHLLVPFKCGTCIFGKLQGWNRILLSTQDTLLFACIQRMKLDAFWSRAKSTTVGNRDKVAFPLKLSTLVGLNGQYEAEGPFPDFDYCGYEVAVKMLLHSRRPGKYSERYTQFNTVSKLRSSFSNHCRASAKSNWVSLGLGGQKGKYQRFSSDPCSSFWFYQFVEGARHSMGQDWRPNKALGVDGLLLLMLKPVELKILESVNLREENRWVVFHAFTVVC